MDINEKVNLNKEIKNYDGSNSFIISLKKQLNTTKLRETLGAKTIKVLSDKQYVAAKRILESN